MNPPNPDARLWLFDFDNTLAALEREVDWPGSRRELEAFLRDEGIDEKTFAEIPKGNLPLYAALHTRWLRTPPPEANMPTNLALAHPSIDRMQSRVTDHMQSHVTDLMQSRVTDHTQSRVTDLMQSRVTDHIQSRVTDLMQSRVTDLMQSRVLESPDTNPKDAGTPSEMPIGAASQPSRETAETLLRRSSEIIERHELIGVERAQPTAGAIELLAALVARGAVVVIVTSNSSRTVARWLERHSISELVRAIVGRDSLLALKPSPEMVLHALKLAALPAPASRTASLAARSVFVGDPEPVSADQAVFVGDSEPVSAGQPVFVGDTEPVSADQAVFVGDSDADLGAARAARVGFYGIAIGHHRLFAAGAAEVFASPATLHVHLVRAKKASGQESTEVAPPAVASTGKLI